MFLQFLYPETLERYGVKTKITIGKVRYQTYQQMCWAMLKSTVTMKGAAGKNEQQVFELDELVEQLISDPKAAQTVAALDVQSAQLGNNPVLLIDEVDVLFGALFGSTLNPVCQAPHETCAKIQQKMWENRRELTQDELDVAVQGNADSELLKSKLWGDHMARFTSGLLAVKDVDSDKNKEAWRLEKVSQTPVKVLHKHVELGVTKWSHSILVGYQNSFQVR